MQLVRSFSFCVVKFLLQAMEDRLIGGLDLAVGLRVSNGNKLRSAAQVNAPGNIVALISCLNRIRHENSALQTHLGLRFFDSGNDQVLYFAKSTFDGSNIILVAISLDPHRPQEAHLEIPYDLLPPLNDTTATRRGEPQMHGENQMHVEELLRGQSLVWRGARQHWYFDPDELPLAIWRVIPPDNTHAHEVDAQWGYGI